MKLAALALLAVLVASAFSAAAAQPLPVGSAVIAFEERLRIGDDCEPYRGVGLMFFSVYPNGAFAAHIDAGTFTGMLVPDDPRRRVWKLRFDPGSFTFYKRYLEAGARASCGADASITDGGVRSFVLQFPKHGGEAVLKLRTSFGGTGAFQGARGRHRIDGKGLFEQGLLPPAPQPKGGGSVSLIVPSRL